MCMGQAYPRGSMAATTMLLLPRCRPLFLPPRPMALHLLRVMLSLALKPPLPPLLRFALRLHPRVNRPALSLLPVRPANRLPRLKCSLVLPKGRAAPPTRRAKPSR